jgi:hypothetical protein
MRPKKMDSTSWKIATSFRKEKQTHMVNAMYKKLTWYTREIKRGKFIEPHEETNETRPNSL